MTLLKNKTKKIVPAIHGTLYLHNLLPVLLYDFETEVGVFKKEAFILKIITSKLKYIINERGRRSKSRTLARGGGDGDTDDTDPYVAYTGCAAGQGTVFYLSVL